MRSEDFNRLFEEHAQELFGFLVYRTGDRQLAEDLASETFERALRARRRFDPRRGAEKPWLYSIALNLLRDHARRAGAESRALERVAEGAVEGEADPRLGRVEEGDRIARALGALSPEEREAVALRLGAGLTAKEAARATGERQTTIQGRFYRALARLREELGPGEGG